MNFLRKSYCMFRREGVFYLNSCRFICNLNKGFVFSKRHFGNGLLLLTRPRPRSLPRPTCILSSIPSVGQVNPNNCEQFKRNSSVTSRLHEESKNEDSNEKINKCLKQHEWNIQRGDAVSKTYIDEILYKIEKGGIPQDIQHAGLILLHGCGNLMCSQVPVTRVQLANRIVSTLQPRGLSMTVDHYNALLTSYIENRHRTKPSEFLEKMSAPPNEETFHLLLWLANNADESLDLVQRMKDRGFAVSEPVFNAILNGHGRARDLTSAESVLETMRSAQLQPSSRTFTALLTGLAECGDAGQMNKTFREAVAAGATPSRSQVLSVVRSLATSGHTTSIPAVLQWLPELDDAGGSKTLRNMLKHFVHLKLDDAVLLLIDKLPVEESEPFGQFLLQEMVKADRPVKSILALCNVLSERNPLALSHATQAALRPPKTDIALQLFEAMKESEAPVRAHFYWPLLIAARQKGEEALFQLVQHMRKLDIPTDPITMSVYLLRFVSLEAPTTLLRRLQDLGFTLTEVFVPVLRALISNGRLDLAHQLCGEHPIRVDCEPLMRPLAVTLLKGAELSAVVQLLKTLVNSCQHPDDWVGRFMLELFTNPRTTLRPDRMEIIIKGLSDAGLRCSPNAADMISRQVSAPQPGTRSTIFEALSRMVNPEQQALMSTDSYTLHPKNMNLNELECLLAELQAKKMNTRGVLRLLLLKYCKLGHLKSVENTKQELERAGHKFSLGMKAALFDYYVKTSQVNEAKLSFLELCEETDFSLDSHKAIDFATLLVTHDQTQDALSALEKMSMRGIKGGPDISRNCRNLLLCTSLRKEPEDTRMMIDRLVELGYCIISNKMLGPLIKTHLLRDDLEGAVKEFSACVAKYNLTPLHYELHCRLIREASSEKVMPPRVKELIQEVLVGNQTVHGTGSATCSFAVALAETGRTDWLAQYIKEYGKQIDVRALMQRCRRLEVEDKGEALQNLISVCGDAKLFNIAPLFKLVLQIHCRHGDTQAAMDLFTTMQETGHQPAKSFINMLTGLLKSHKIQVPSSVPTLTEALNPVG